MLPYNAYNFRRILLHQARRFWCHAQAAEIGSKSPTKGIQPSIRDSCRQSFCVILYSWAQIDLFRPSASSFSRSRLGAKFRLSRQSVGEALLGCSCRIGIAFFRPPSASMAPDNISYVQTQEYCFVEASFLFDFACLKLSSPGRCQRDEKS